ncbi:hypothetical protein CLCR_07841 [Cladophialophora carrionii]|uniref:Uncharacterized protein n=1 Tax=Cladophialophora carrionii TaxID=86049 RepID=A0A1C1CNJ3_9EURO|nr:hypothetical protein CLCR_07841 [Cladophialophora carrionii]
MAFGRPVQLQGHGWQKLRFSTPPRAKEVLEIGHLLDNANPNCCFIQGSLGAKGRLDLANRLLYPVQSVYSRGPALAGG